MNELLNIMRTRQSSRMPLDPIRHISKPSLLKILEAARWAPTAHNMQNFEIVVVTDGTLLRTIESIKRPISETFVRENYAQLSFTEEELEMKKTGLLAANFPSSWRKPDFKLDKDAKEDIANLRSLPPCSAMMVVVFDPAKRAPASEGDFLGFMSLGCVMENMWLMANALNIHFHIISSLSAAPIEEEVKKMLKIPNNLKIAFTCRLGYDHDSTHKRYLRVRREIKDFASHNQYGSWEME